MANTRRYARQHRDIPAPDGGRPFFNREARNSWDNQLNDHRVQQAENELVAQRREIGNAIPFSQHIPRNDTTAWMGDRAVDVANLPYRGAGIVAGGSLLTGGLLNAYSQQQEEGLPTGLAGTVGRGARNLVDAGGSLFGVSNDPLAEARRKIQETDEALG